LRDGPAPLGEAGVLIRPHPQNVAQWHGVELAEHGPLSIWPRDPSARVDDQSKADFFDSLYHSAAIVGINTSALIEAGIVGRPVFTVLAPEFRASQEGTLHFHYLIEASAGFLRVASDLDEHVAQLSAALASDGPDERARAFVRSFVRPAGLDRPATPILADALQRLQHAPMQPARPPLWAKVARPGLLVVAALARFAWSRLQSKDHSAGSASRATVAAGADVQVSRSALPR
jgi:hypothetical protein